MAGSAPPSNGGGFVIDIAPAGEFVVVYGVLFIAAIAASKLVSSMLVSSLDRATPKLPPRPGAKIDARHARYEIDALPREDELWGVAFLRGGVDRVASVLLAQAVADGWLMWSEGRAVVGTLPSNAPTRTRELYNALERAGRVTEAGAHEVATRVAKKLAPTVEAELESYGLLRPSFTRVVGALPLVVTAACMAVLGILRALRGFDVEGATAIVAAEIVGLSLAALGVARVPALSEPASAYLTWLEAATESLRTAVKVGRARQTFDVMLTAAFAEPGEAMKLAQVQVAEGES